MIQQREKYKRRNASETTVPRLALQLTDFEFNWKRQSKEQMARKRVADRLLHGDMPCTVEQVAKQMRTNCKLVRQVVTDLKRNGLLLEATIPDHALLRVST